MRAGPVVRLCLLTAVALVAALSAAGPASAEGPVAPGCDEAHPTALGGEATGSDGYSINMLLGMDLKDAAGATVDVDGAPYTRGGYGYIDNVNPYTSLNDSQVRTGNRRWGVNDSSAYLCVARTVTQVFLEGYPKDSSGVTTKTRYGATSRYFVPLTAGAVNDFPMLLPLRGDLGGVTGNIVGSLTFQGAAVDPSQITRMRAFSVDGGPGCGISGFSAHHDALARRADGTATDYLLGYLAGGRCGAPTQRYSVQADCTCGGVKVTRQGYAEVATAADVRLDLSFS